MPSTETEEEALLQKPEGTWGGQGRVVTHCLARNWLRALCFRMPSMTWRCRYTNTAPRNPQQILGVGRHTEMTPSPLGSSRWGGVGKHQATSFPFYPPPPNNLPPRLCQPHLLPRPGSLPIPSHTRPRPQLTTPRGGDPTDPMTAKAGSSCRSKGKSIRKLVLKRAVMVTTGEKGRGSRTVEGAPQDPTARRPALRINPFPPPAPTSPT